MARRNSEWAGALYDAYAAGMFAYAMALLGSAEEAEDAVQEVFVKVCVSGRAPENARHYLLRSVRNEAYSRLRRRRLRFWKQVRLARDARLFVEPKTGEADAEAMNAAFGQLPVEQREVVMLKFYEGLTFQEIAEVTGVSPNTAASRYRYGIEKLRGLLREEDPNG